jgi:hypothetical protein
LLLVASFHAHGHGACYVRADFTFPPLFTYTLAWSELLQLCAVFLVEVVDFNQRFVGVRLNGLFDPEVDRERVNLKG